MTLRGNAAFGNVPGRDGPDGAPYGMDWGGCRPYGDILWTGNYGSPEYWVSEPGKKGREPLPVRSATLSADGKTVSLKFDKLQPVHQLMIKYKIRGADGSPISQELDYTIHKIP